MDVEKYNIEELEKLIELKKAQIELHKIETQEEQKTTKTDKQKKKRMKFGKKMLVLSFLICFALILFTMIMIYIGKDTTSLTILAGAGVAVLPVMYGVYDHYSTQINLKHMEENYIPNYDDEVGLR